MQSFFGWVFEGIWYCLKEIGEWFVEDFIKEIVKGWGDAYEDCSPWLGYPIGISLLLGIGGAFVGAFAWVIGCDWGKVVLGFGLLLFLVAGFFRFLVGFVLWLRSS
jgi:hypothetical protein